MEEPTRKSALDCAREAKKLDTCRLIFCAEMKKNCGKSIAQLFETAINEKCLQLVTGLLLVRANMIIHLIESSEDEVFRLCDEVLVNNLEVLKNAKCLYVQNGARKRFFQKWYARRINDCNATREMNIEKLQDNFETVSDMHREIVIGLHELYNELYEASLSKSHEDFLKQLDSISKEGHSNVPCDDRLEFILKSRWGYDLIDLVKNYCRSSYPHDFDDCSSVSKIIQQINLDEDELQSK